MKTPELLSRISLPSNVSPYQVQRAVTPSSRHLVLGERCRAAPALGSPVDLPLRPRDRRREGRRRHREEVRDKREREPVQA